MVGFVNRPITVEQNVECNTHILHPLLDGWKSSKRDNENAGIELFDFFLAGAQLCGMFTTGYSTKMTEKDKQNVITVFQDLVEHDLFATGRGESEIGCRGVEFEFQVVVSKL